MNVSRDLKEKISKLKFINAIKSNKNFEHSGMRGVREENKKKSKRWWQKRNSVDKRRKFLPL